MSIFVQTIMNRSEGMERRRGAAVRTGWTLALVSLMAVSSFSIAQETDDADSFGDDEFGDIFGDEALGDESVVEGPQDTLSVEVVIERRQLYYGDIGAAYKSMTDELRRKKPGMYMYGRYLKQLTELSHTQAEQDWFPTGSGPESGLETAATPEIWTDSVEFRKWIDALPTEADKLREIVASRGPLGDVRKQHKALGKTCKGCHKPFRVEDD